MNWIETGRVVAALLNHRLMLASLRDVDGNAIARRECIGAM
jgi:hypothetical protein